MSRKANECSVLDASVDWLTVTMPVGFRSRFAANKAERIICAQEERGFERKYTNRLGFTGDRIEGMFYGFKGDTLMVITSGDTAAKHADFFIKLAENVTRLDLAVTLHDDIPSRDWTEIALKQVMKDGRVEGGSLTTHRIEGTPTGRTLYIGSRSSDRYIRIYDKTAESPETYAPTAWRWEIEYKRPSSGVVAKRLLGDGISSRTILEHCTATFANLHIALPCRSIGPGWIARRPTRLTTSETRLRYAQRVVAPFLKGLVEAVGEDRVSQALDRSLFTRDRLISTENGEVLR
jgi:DNA relaxase NicK